MKWIPAFTLMLLTGNVFSQNCSNYYYLQNNKIIEMTVSNKNGKEAGKMIYTISNATTSGSSATATVSSEFVDTKGKTISKTINNVKCENGVMQMNMKTFVPAAQQEQMQSGTANVPDVYLEYPADMKVGDQLKDGQFKMDYKSASGLEGSVDISITERKVEGKETVTTSAGTWECFKISATNKINSKVSNIGIPITMTITEWYAPGFGIVKTESKAGKTEITAIK